MYTLKRMAVEGHAVRQPTAPDFSKMFINWVENYGRVFELGLMSQHMLRHNPLGVFKIAEMGIGHGDQGPHGVHAQAYPRHRGSQAIIARAKELEANPCRQPWSTTTSPAARSNATPKPTTRSSMATTKPLGMGFAEIDDWNGGGATEYISLHMLASYG